MSEYQYYEFLAIDTPLSDEQIDAVRKFSSRADISAKRFTNEYSYGDFKGDTAEFLTEWYDAMVYIANWGSHSFMCRISIELVDLKYAKACCDSDCARLTIDGNNVIFEFASDPDDGGDEEDYDGRGHMDSLAPVRAELMAGDLRPLYLAWLLCAQSGLLADDDVEPAVPPGLAKLTTAQEDFVGFLRIDRDLIDAASTDSGNVPDPSAGIDQWLRDLPTVEKDAILVSMLAGDDPQQVARLRRRYARETASPAAAAIIGKRTVKDLIIAMKARNAAWEQKQRAEAAEQSAIKQAAKAAARMKYLDELAARAPRAWAEVDQMIASKSPTQYQKAVEQLKDLREMAGRQRTMSMFHAHLSERLIQHQNKPSFVKRVKEAGLFPS